MEAGWRALTIAVVMGVSGSGKSTTGRLLADRLGWDFAEGDDLHPPANVAKMVAGVPLTDADRAPWLAAVEDWIDGHAGRPGVITCSALKRAYRDRLRRDGVVFVHLTGSAELIAARLAARQGHFMPPALLASQFAVLEEPGQDEPVIRVDLADPPDVQVERVVAALRRRSAAE